MRKLGPWLGAIALMSVGCSSGPEVEGTTTTTSSPAPTVQVGSTHTTSSSITATSILEPTPDLAVFIAAIDEALAGTSYEDAALDDPEVFIAVGQLFCELIDEGASMDEVLSEYLEALRDKVTGEIADEEAVVTGVVMGASIEVLCPENRPDS